MHLLYMINVGCEIIHLLEFCPHFLALNLPQSLIRAVLLKMSQISQTSPLLLVSLSTEYIVAKLELIR